VSNVVHRVIKAVADAARHGRKSCTCPVPVQPGSRFLACGRCLLVCYLECTRCGRIANLRGLASQTEARMIPAATALNTESLFGV
jgi:hypothetical protein